MFSAFIHGFSETFFGADLWEMLGNFTAVGFVIILIAVGISLVGYFFSCATAKLQR
jgi:hypothetical protein